MSNEISDILISKLSEFVNTQIGLFFPEKSYHELGRRIASSARQFEFTNTNSFLQWLMSSPLTQDKIETLASHLTVGETYFFREQKQFAVLEEHILPKLIQSRRKNDRRFRCWSAGCCTGEEPYSLAILLHRLIPDWLDWDITILATDINPLFLKKAVQGRYGKWSFRNVPEWIQECFFEKKDETIFEILPSIKKKVIFSYLNLAKDTYPSLMSNTNGMDIIFCRNVLMYFSPEKAKKVIENLYGSLAEGGWLIVSSCELSPILFPQFQTVNFPGTILYQKNSHHLRPIDFVPEKKEIKTEESIPFSLPWPSEFSDEKEKIPAAVDLLLQPAGEAERTESRPLFEDKAGRLSEQDSVEEIKAEQGILPARDATEIVQLARGCANLGNLQEALALCEKAIAADCIDTGLHYLRAMILQEQGNLEETTASLQRVLYLDPRFTLGYFALGNLARQQGKIKKSDKCFANVLSLLQDYQPDDLLPESGGMTAGRLVEIVRSTIWKE